jgi:hypothetical protein
VIATTVMIHGGFWHQSEVPALPAYVGYRWKTGQHMLNTSFSPAYGSH